MSGKTTTQSTPRIARAHRTSYLTLRITGVMLAVLALGHYALTHIVHDVANTDASYVAKQWSSAIWVTWDGLLLATALVHAVAGMMTIIRDHRPGALSRRRWMVASLGLAIVLLMIGAATITFSVV